MATNNVNTQIQKLIDKTKEGKIDWKYVSSNGLRWTQKNGDRLYVTLLNKLLNPSFIGSSMVMKETYVLIVQAMNPNEIIMQVDTDETTGDILGELFNIAINSSKDNATNIIDTLIESL